MKKALNMINKSINQYKNSHICENFINKTEKLPEDIFISFYANGEYRNLTRRWILDRSLVVSNILSDNFIQPDNLVLIVLEHCVDLYPSFLGCLIHGSIPAFLPPLTAKQDKDIFRESMRGLFDRIKPKIVLTSSKSLEYIPDGTHKIVNLNDFSCNNYIEQISMAHNFISKNSTNLDKIAFLQHSSGTTGHKKGVSLTHNSVIEHIMKYSQAIGINADDKIASWLPLYHDMGLITSFLLPVVIGCPIISIDALEWVAKPTMLLDAIELHKAAFSWLPNFAFHHILRGAQTDECWDLKSIKSLINCSEPCRAETFSVFLGKFNGMGIGAENLGVAYAMAETVFAVSQTQTGIAFVNGNNMITRPFLSSGKPLPGVEIIILDENDNPVFGGEVGEICVKSTTLFTGYYLQPELSETRLRDGLYRTRDIGCIENGELFVIGRIDDLLIINGRNLLAHELEEALGQLSGVTPGRVLVGSEFIARLGATRLIVLAELNDESLNKKTIETKIRDTVLAQTGIFPGIVKFIPRGFLVKSTSGKIARAESMRKYNNKSAITS